MRDPARIDAMIEKLRALWKRYPDLRLGQLVTNLAKSASKPADSDIATFYIEDTKMDAQIDVVTARGSLVE